MEEEEEEEEEEERVNQEEEENGEPCCCIEAHMSYLQLINLMRLINLHVRHPTSIISTHSPPEKLCRRVS